MKKLLKSTNANNEVGKNNNEVLSREMENKADSNRYSFESSYFTETMEMKSQNGRRGFDVITNKTSMPWYLAPH